jgi:hypothetical protein
MRLDHNQFENVTMSKPAPPSRGCQPLRLFSAGFGKAPQWVERMFVRHRAQLNKTSNIFAAISRWPARGESRQVGGPARMFPPIKKGDALQSKNIATASLPTGPHVSKKGADRAAGRPHDGDWSLSSSNICEKASIATLPKVLINRADSELRETAKVFGFSRRRFPRCAGIRPIRGRLLADSHRPCHSQKSGRCARFCPTERSKISLLEDNSLEIGTGNT